MSDIKELALEAAAKGSPAAMVLIVLLVTGAVVQNQAPADHRVFVETRSVCQSLLSETSFERELNRPRALARVAPAVPNKTDTGLPEYAVAMLSAILPLLPAAGLARNGYREVPRNNGPPIAHALLNQPLLELAAVHALGQAGTFGASQLSRFLGPKPGSKFFERCGTLSAFRVCRRAAMKNLGTLELLPESARPKPTTTTTKRPSTSQPANSSPSPSNCRCSRSVRSERPAVNASDELVYDYPVYDFDFPAEVEDSEQVPALCENTSAQFSELYAALHENPKFAYGSFGAALVTLAFGFYLQRRGNVSAAGEPSRTRADCLWTFLEGVFFAALAVAGFCLLVSFFSEARRSVHELFLALSLGVAVQLGVVLWALYGNLFFDLRRCGNVLSAPPASDGTGRPREAPGPETGG
jgi:hypothetical protein